MKRMRLSTTVDAARLQRARSLTQGKDAEMIDRALEALIERIESEREADALARLPYGDDPELQLPPPGPGADLPYDGDVPHEIMELARRRRARRR